MLVALFPDDLLVPGVVLDESVLSWLLTEAAMILISGSVLRDSFDRLSPLAATAVEDDVDEFCLTGPSS